MGRRSVAAGLAPGSCRTNSGAGTRTPAARTKTWCASQLHHPRRRTCAPILRCDTMPAPTVVILAAGEGTRMRSALPKVLHPICGRPMILWPLLAARAAGAERVIVVDNPKRRLADHLPDDVETAIQERPRGTGDAVAAAAGLLDAGAPVLVINGDMPLITGEAIAGLVAAHEEAQAGATLATMELDEPAGYGRIVRDAHGGVERVVETKADGDATPEELRHPRGQRGPVPVRRRRARRRARRARRRQRPGRALPPRRPAAAARRRPAPSRPSRSPTPTWRSASTTASTSRRSPGSPSSASTAPTSAPASRSSTRRAR